MRPRRFMLACCAALAALALAAPWLVPGLLTQLAFLWLMIVFALTWDILGGQAGYNSFGNIVFFGVGCYACAVLQRDAALPYLPGLAAGLATAAAAGTLAAAVLGPGLLGLRGHYFAIATLGLGFAAGDLAAGWDYIGGASGIVAPLFPGPVGAQQRFFYYLLLLIALLTFMTLRWLYGTRFGTALNAIRDDEDKAEAMGIRTHRHKATAWCIAAFFLALAGGAAGNLVGYIDPREFAFAGSSFGVWMVLMAILGGRGSLLGPVLGAAIFHATQELFWTYLLGWQRVAMGLFVVLVVVFLPQGVLGWLHRSRARRWDTQAVGQ